MIGIANMGARPAAIACQKKTLNIFFGEPAKIIIGVNALAIARARSVSLTTSTDDGNTQYRCLYFLSLSLSLSLSFGVGRLKTSEKRREPAGAHANFVLRHLHL